MPGVHSIIYSCLVEGRHQTTGALPLDMLNSHLKSQARLVITQVGHFLTKYTPFGRECITRGWYALLGYCLEERKVDNQSVASGEKSSESYP